MKAASPYLNDYELPRILFLGSVATSALSFLFLFAQRASYHSLFNVPVIDEMVAYAQFFFFACASYFGAAILAHNLSGWLAKYVPASLSVSLFGSFLFCFSFFSFVYVVDLVTYRAGDPFRLPPGSVRGVLLSSLIGAAILATIVGILVALVSAFCSAIETRKKSVR